MKTSHNLSAAQHFRAIGAACCGTRAGQASNGGFAFNFIAMLRHHFHSVR
jgi:hypothetical protein